MKISDQELSELKYLSSGGTIVSHIMRPRLMRKWLITTKSVFSNSPYNGQFDELTYFGQFVVRLIVDRSVTA
jgi:hypothetical protein